MSDKQIIEQLVAALIAAQEHLEYVGYGDTYERGLAYEAKLPEQIEAALDAAQLKPQEELSDSYVQRVPDHCDRILWRDRYYSLPLPTDAQPALTLTDISAEAKKLAPILRGMCEGGGPEEGTDIYADDYFAADGDEFVIRAAQLLERIAILHATQPVVRKDSQDAARFNMRRLHDQITETVVSSLQYFEFIDKGGANYSHAEIVEATQGGMGRYRNDAMFRAKVQSLTAGIIQEIQAAMAQQEGEPK